METENQPSGIWNVILTALAQDVINQIPHLAVLGIDAVKSFLHPHKDAILGQLIDNKIVPALSTEAHTDTLTPYQQCLQDHAGECGVCNKTTGAFTPCA